MVCAGFASPPAVWLSDEAIEWWPAYREESSAVASRPAAAVVVVVVVESLVAALSGFVVAELKPARGNWEEVERPSDICKERRPIDTQGLSMRKERKRKRLRERKGPPKKKEQPAHKNTRPKLGNYLPPFKCLVSESGDKI
jgi:hypothetical protein